MKNLVFLILGIAAVLIFRYIQLARTPPFVPQPSTFTLAPPAQAITGTLTETNGDVEQLTREADDYTEATPAGTIRQGESVATKDGSATITLGALGTISMEEDSEISFVSLIPESLLLRQKSGTILYEVNSMNPFSIRISYSLITLQGDATITMDKITLARGAARLAFVDDENTTIVRDILVGETVRLRK